MNVKTYLAMILSGTVSAASASAQVVPPPATPPIIVGATPPVPKPSPVPTPIPAPPSPAKATPKTGRTGGTPGYVPEGQTASAAKPGKPGGAPGLLVGEWSVPAARTTGLGTLMGATARQPSESVSIKADGESITFIQGTRNGDLAQSYPLSGAMTKVQLAGVEAEARVLIAENKLLVETHAPSGTTVVKWFVEDGDLIRERQVGERTVRTVFKKRGG